MSLRDTDTSDPVIVNLVSVERGSGDWFNFITLVNLVKEEQNTVVLKPIGQSVVIY